MCCTQPPLLLLVNNGPHADVHRSTVLLFASLFLLALGLLFASLLALHTYLLCSAQTTYELLKGCASVDETVTFTH